MAALRVLHVSMECFPFSKVGGMADVVGALPAALAAHDVEARVLTPWHRRLYRGDVGAPVASFDVSVGGAAHRVDLREAGEFGLLVDAPTAFDRPGVYDDPSNGDGFGDNLFRFVVLQQAARAALRDGAVAADVVHCHDNHTGLVPVYLRNDGGPPSVFTIHNLAYQGLFPGADFALTGLNPGRFYGYGPFEFYGDLSLMKAGLYHADVVTTVSPAYAAEIVRPEYGHGLDGVLRDVDLRGLLNGIDETIWNPRTDPRIAATYDADRPQGKARCKRALQERAGIAVDPDAPLCGMVTRVTYQKGVDVVAAVLPWLMRAGAQFVLLGTGDPRILDLFRGAHGRWPDRVGLLEAYDEDLAHAVYAGADIFCMPSRFEPCGLGQMYALRYGAVPVVTRMGGLKDTVKPFDETRTDGTGVLADWATVDSFQGALDYALTLHGRPELWRRVRANAMRQDFSWTRSASAYADLYRSLVAP